MYVQNTLTGAKDEFAPLASGKVKMYNCGPTVYSEAHIGNLRSYIFADVVRRMLEYNDYKVKQVINITDVGHLVSDADEGEDKMEKAASERGESASDIAEHFTALFMEDLSRLNIETEDTEFPRATRYIDEQIALIKTLEERGYTYQTADGIYFDTTRFPAYGALGGINLEGLQEGARVAKKAGKKNLTDFALWKFSPKGKKRAQEWESPWGVGFPGWHIECSAMSRALLGKELDIHTGGVDHIPVHHNNEIAQSECASGKKFARYWMHNEHLLIDGKKISKSLGNTIALRQIVDRGYSPLALRYLFLSAHYSTQLNFTWESLDAAATALKRLKKAFLEQSRLAEIATSASRDGISVYRDRFHKAINDDLDTPKALAIVWEMLKDERVSAAAKKEALADFDRVLGLQLAAVLAEEKKMHVRDIPEDVQKLLDARETARQNQNWAQSDELRDEIAQRGYTVTDTASGQLLTPTV